MYLSVGKRLDHIVLQWLLIEFELEISLKGGMMKCVCPYKVVIDLLWSHSVHVHPVYQLRVPAGVPPPVEFREAMAATSPKTSVD